MGTASATIQRETLSDALWAELLPLLERHWQEVAHYPDIPLEIDRVRYDAAALAGQVRVYTVRTAEWTLIGYASFFVNVSAHYSSALHAVEDVIFVAPEHRRSHIGAQLITWCDQQLAAEGVRVVMHHVKTKHNFGPLLERLGYEHVESGYWKRLDLNSESPP